MSRLSPFMLPAIRRKVFVVSMFGREVSVVVSVGGVVDGLVYVQSVTFFCFFGVRLGFFVDFLFFWFIVVPRALAVIWLKTASHTVGWTV